MRIGGGEVPFGEDGEVCLVAAEVDAFLGELDLVVAEC